MELAKKPTAVTIMQTRRKLLTGMAITVGGFAAASTRQAQSQSAMKEQQSTGTEGLLTYLHQEIGISASPRRVYDALLDSKQFAAFTKMAAEISGDAGGAFSMFGGLIVGRNIELVPNQRIVQAWRPSSWTPGIYSLVKFELREEDQHTKVVLDHTGFPEGSFRHLDSGWYERYWEPLKKFLN